MASSSEPLSLLAGSTVSMPHERPRPDRTVRSGIRLPGDTHRLALRLLAQQFWLFGCDIRRAEGNVLLELGFEKHRPPAGSRVTASRYTRVFSDDRAVMLWGFGLYWRDPVLGGLYVPRSEFSPMLRTSSALPLDAWDPDHMDGLSLPCTAQQIERCRILLGDALGWIRDYERAVAALAGNAYRAHAVQAWKRPCGPATELAAQWQVVSDAVASLPAAGV